MSEPGKASTLECVMALTLRVWMGKMAFPKHKASWPRNQLECGWGSSFSVGASC